MTKQELILEIKKHINYLAKFYDKFSEIETSRRFANSILSTRISKNFYGKTFAEIKEEFYIDEKISFLSLLDENHLEMLCSLLATDVSIIKNYDILNFNELDSKKRSAIRGNIVEAEYDNVIRKKLFFKSKYGVMPYTNLKEILEPIEKEFEMEEMHNLKPNTNDFPIIDEYFIEEEKEYINNGNLDSVLPDYNESERKGRK